MDENLTRDATLAGYEPDLKVALRIDHLGHLEAEVEITPDHLTQFHQFRPNLDQSYLTGLIASCGSILERFPVIGTD